MASHTCRSAFSSDRRYSRAGSFPASVLKKRTSGTQELYNTGAIFARADPRPADLAVSSYQPCKPQDALERRDAAFADPPRSLSESLGRPPCAQQTQLVAEDGLRLAQLGDHQEQGLARIQLPEGAQPRRPPYPRSTPQRLGTPRTDSSRA